MMFTKPKTQNSKPIDNEALHALWCKIQKGEEKAFSRLYAEMAYNLFGYGMKIIDNDQWVEDCIHDLFLELWSKKNKLPGVRDIKIYLMVSFRRKLLKFHRSYSKTFVRQSECPSLWAGLVQDYDNSEEVEGLNFKIKNIIELLSKRQKEVILLRFYHNLSYDKIAEILEIDKKHANNLASQAFKFIRINLPNIVSTFLFFVYGLSASHLL